MRALLVVSLLLSVPALAEDDKPLSQGAAKPAYSDLIGPKRYTNLCEGDGCDAFLPVLKRSDRFTDYRAQKRWGAALGGLSGALIGEEIGGAPGAIALGALGAVTGYNYTDRERWEEDAKAYDAAWQRGDDIYYNPAHRLPLEAHWMHAGPAVPLPDKKK